MIHLNQPNLQFKTIGRLISSVTLFLLLAITGSPERVSGSPNQASATDTSSIMNEQSNTPIQINVSDDIVQPNVKKLGINLGHIDQFGAAQLMKNIIKNPGFEAGQFGMIFNAQGNNGGTRVQAVPDFWRTEWNRDDLGIGQPAGFWDNAEVRVLTGAQAGKSGTVSTFELTENLYTFQVNVPEIGAGPDQYDAVAVQKMLPGYFGGRDPRIIADPAESRPNSSGSQSLRLATQETAEGDFKTSFSYYLDSTDRDGDHSAGKLFKINGEWHFEIWAKGATDGDFFDVYFKRQCLEGGGNFFYQRFNVTTEWQLLTHDFMVEQGIDGRGPDTCGNGEEGILEFHIRVPFGNSDIWVDDVYLGKANPTNPTAFSDKFVGVLKEYNPGIVRNWGDQLGSTLENELADSYARRSVGHAPERRETRNYHFGLHEFFELAAELEAEPWYVIPPTFTPAEIENLIAYISAPAGSHPYADIRANLGQTAPWNDVFTQIHLEFGNEMWGSNGGNDPFRGATMRGGQRLGQLANSRFATLKASPYYNAQKLNLIIGGQYNVSETQGVIEQESSAHNAIAVSPYFAYDIDRFSSQEELLYPLFARPQQAVTSGKMAQSQTAISQLNPDTDLAIYEINFHTTRTDLEIPLETRNKFVTGMGGGLALPLHMLTYMKETGVKNQAAFTALQYSHQIQGEEYVKLWGLMRDLEGTGNKRPTWLGTELANRAIGGNLVQTSHTGHNPSWIQEPFNEITAPIEVPFVHSFAFKDGTQTNLILFNLHLDAAQQVQINAPGVSQDYVSISQIAPESIWSNNEAETEVTIAESTIDSLNETITLPKHSITLVQWDTAERVPLAADDLFIVEFETTLIAKGNLLANDRVEDRGEKLVELLSPPAAGTLSLDSDGTFEYSPPVGFSGEETATYRVFDGSRWSEPAEIKFVIFPTNPVKIYLPTIQK